ncbi:MAG: hypothetical protein D6677_01500 [Calditrichaeota bacterium]|nr:MAG: hypothetical protein D6677_01500 [Calditrichota bacterium]
MAARVGLEKAKHIKKQHQADWLRHGNVVSIGIAAVGKKTGIIIGVKNNPDALRDKIPENIDGVPILIKTIRELRAL